MNVFLYYYAENTLTLVYSFKNLAIDEYKIINNKIQRIDYYNNISVNGLLEITKIYNVGIRDI